MTISTFTYLWSYVPTDNSIKLSKRRDAFRKRRHVLWLSSCAKQLTTFTETLFCIVTSNHRIFSFRTYLFIRFRERSNYVILDGASRWGILCVKHSAERLYMCHPRYSKVTSMMKKLTFGQLVFWLIKCSSEKYLSAFATSRTYTKLYSEGLLQINENITFPEYVPVS
jgi:hypothetical protein